MVNCKECLHQCYTDDLVSTEETCNFFIDKNKYVEQKHGRWIDEGQLLYMSLHRWSCSVCKETTEMFPDGLFKHCPNCGTIMDLEE